MISFIKSLFVNDPIKKVLAARDKKYKIAVELQRNGKLREYAEVMKEIELLEEEYAALVAKRDQ
tara:strand:+ start:1492 stop:1683 length:192 start_codon:yes stop_codon:yes gene_type:complete